MAPTISVFSQQKAMHGTFHKGGLEKHFQMYVITIRCFLAGNLHFYQHCAPNMKELPNMGVTERGKPNEASLLGPVADPRSSSTFTIPAPIQASLPATNLHGDSSSLAKPVAAGTNGRGVLGTWAAGWRTMIWEKWRWGALIALAVVVSRLSS